MKRYQELMTIRVIITLEDENSVRVYGRSVRQIKTRILSKVQANKLETAKFNCRVRYLPHKVEDQFGDMFWVDNDFDRVGLNDCLKALSIFTAKDEVISVQRNWGERV